MFNDLIVQSAQSLLAPAAVAAAVSGTLVIAGTYLRHRWEAPDRLRDIDARRIASLGAEVEKLWREIGHSKRREARCEKRYRALVRKAAFLERRSDALDRACRELRRRLAVPATGDAE